MTVTVVEVVDWVGGLMMSSRVVVLVGVVGQIMFTHFPEDFKFALGSAVFEPRESHVDALGACLFDSPSEDARCSDIIYFQQG